MSDKFNAGITEFSKEKETTGMKGEAIISNYSQVFDFLF